MCYVRFIFVVMEKIRSENKLIVGKVSHLIANVEEQHVVQFGKLKVYNFAS